MPNGPTDIKPFCVLWQVHMCMSEDVTLGLEGQRFIAVIKKQIFTVARRDVHVLCL